MKKKIFLSLLAVFILWNLLYFFFPWEKYFPEYVIGKKNYEDLFSYCVPEISLDGYPMTAKEWRKQADKQEKKVSKSYNYRFYWPIEPHHISPDDSYTGKYEEVKTIQLLNLLGDNFNLNSFYSQAFNLDLSNDEISPNVYYDHTGKLIMVEKQKQGPMLSYTSKRCSYNNKGNLIEATYENPQVKSSFNKKGQFLYNCYFIGVTCMEKNYNEYILK